MTNPPTDRPNQNVMAGLLQLQHRARHAATRLELAFLMVNETHGLTPYRQAVFWDFSGTVIALSGVTHPEPNAPMTLWLQRLAKPLEAMATPAGLPLVATDLPSALGEEWTEWLPTHGLLLALVDPSRNRQGMLLLARDHPWTDEERAMLAFLVDGYAQAQAWHFLRPAWRWTGASWRNYKKQWIVLALLIGGILPFIPVQLSVIAPAEVVPVDAMIMRAPLEGVVDRFHVQPNELVIEGQPLFELDGTTLRGKLEVAEQSLTITEAEYRQTAQQAILDGRSKAQLAILAGRIEERRREADYLRSLLERILVKAPKPGITIFNDPMEWIGRPVTTGERVMIVAESTNTELEAWLALGDLVIQETGGPVTLFLNVDPLHPVRANVRYIAYEAMPRPDGAMAYRLRATISEGQDKPRVGLKGTARIDGPEVALGYWLLRRPLVVLRQWLGW